MNISKDTFSVSVISTLLLALNFAGICTISYAQSSPVGSSKEGVAALPANTLETMVRNGYGENIRPTVKRKAANQGQPYAPIKKQDEQGQMPEIEMFVGESRVFPAPNVGRIAVGNGQIMTAAALDSKEVIVFANATGTSSLFVWNADGRYQRIKINIVAGDTSRIAREVAAFLTSIPNAKTSIVGDKVIVEGDSLSDADLAKIDQLEKRYPQLVNFTNRVGWEQMVMMDVKVVEFPRSELREIGLKWGAIGGTTVGAIWAPIRRGNDGPYNVNIPATQSGLPITGVDATQSLRLPSALNILGGVNLGLSAQLSLLEQSGQASVLAEPQLSARNGAKASFLAGGEFPYSVSNLTGTTIIFRSYGIKLDISPKVDRNSVIRATIQAEISSIDASVSTAGGPALLSRKIDTEFNVRSGETIVLAGLLQRNVSNDIDKVPMLGDVPVLGALFRSKRFQNKETELVIFVTPTVVDSHSPGLVDRVERTTERLQRQMGRQPYLSNPLQPNTDASDFNRIPVNRSKPAPLSPSPVIPAPAAPAGLLAPSAPSVKGIAMSAPESVSKVVIPLVATVVVAPTVSVPDVPLISASASLPASIATLVSTPVAAKLTPMPAISPASRNSVGSLLQINAESTSLHASADSRSPVLLQMGKGAVVQLSDRPGPYQRLNFWRAVSVGSVEGWVASSTVTPLKLETLLVPNTNTDLSLVASQGRMVGAQSVAPISLPKISNASITATPDLLAVRAAPSRYRVLLDGLALRVAPDVNALTVAKLDAGRIVDGAPDQTQGYWTAITLEGKQGWVATQWLLPQGAPLQK